jgi:TonB-dependent starch-binding outer membrane protein SusC
MNSVNPKPISELTIYQLNSCKSMKKKLLWSFFSIPNSFRKILLIMKLTAFLLMFNLMQIYASVSYGQNAFISLNVQNTKIEEVFRAIEKQSEYEFFYNDKQLDVNQLVTLNVSKANISDVLKSMLKNRDLSYKVIGKRIILVKSNSFEENLLNSVGAKTMKLTGTVSDASTGDPLPGASILVQGTKSGVITDIDGKFSLEVDENSVLIVSFIGYKQQTLTVGNNSQINIKLEPESRNLDEVVVIGYGTTQKKDLTGSVTSLKSKEFLSGAVVSPTDMMQGRAAGVNITNNGGEPGAGASVRIRGSNSIRSGQEPLYVIDGIPLDNSDIQPAGASVTGVGESSKKNPLNFMNPDDIESIDILKDASATAIYGSRGANGVIIVTTKKGQKGKGNVSYSSSFGISKLPKQYDVLSADEFRAFRTSKGLTGDDLGANTNWQDQIFRTAYSQNHSLSFSGSANNSTYRASLSYLDQDGIIKKTGMEKYTGRFVVSHSAWNDKLVLEAGITAARTNDQRAPIGETGGYEGDMLLSALKLNPTYPVYNADGTFYQASKDVRNPLAMIELTNDKTQTDRILSNMSATLKLVKGLNYKLNVAIDQVKSTRSVTQDQKLIYLTNKGTVDVNSVQQNNKLIENYLTYDFAPSTAHKFNFLAGHSYQHFRYYTSGFSEEGLNVEGIDYLNDLAYGNYSQAKVRSDVSVNELQSFFGRVNYDMFGKYMLTVNFRADGSTKFGENNKYGYFPSTALAWRMNEENFIKDLDLFSNLKMRLGWGITGNQEIPNRISRLLLGSTGGAILNGGNTVVTGITLTRTPNPDIKWETTEQYNWGLDFGLLDGRLSGSLDLFSKTTKNVLLEVYSSMPAPTTKVWTNVPDMKILNKGLELTLNGVIINKGDWNWNVGANFSTVKNEVKNLPMSQITTGSPSGPGITGFSSQVIMSGEPIGTFWGYKFLGFDANGKSLYESDANGNPISQVIGCAQPDFTYNFNTSVSWKDFDLSLFFSGVYGNDVYNNLGNVMDQLSLASSGWNTTVNASKSTEALNNKLDYSSRFIEDGSFLRLSSATLGYTLKQTKIKQISKIRFYATGNNLLLFTNYSGYDPEVNANHTSNGVPSMGIGWTTYPKARTFTFGVSVEF